MLSRKCVLYKFHNIVIFILCYYLPTKFFADNFKLTVSEDISRIPCKKAKQLRLQRRKEKCLLKGIDFDSKPKQNPNTGDKTLEEFLTDLPVSYRERLKVIFYLTVEDNINSNQTTEKTRQRLHLSSSPRCNCFLFNCIFLFLKVNLKRPEDSQYQVLALILFRRDE